MIRRATAGDADAIAAIWNHVIRDTARTFTTLEKDPAAIAAAMADHPFHVAIDRDAVQGFVTWGQFRGGPGYAHTMEHSVHVAAAARRRGLGRGLVAACEDHVRGQGVHALVAGIAGENPEGVTFHSALGFREVGRMPEVGRKFGRWHDLILMQKLL